MDSTKPYRVTVPQWLAVLAVWGLVAYGLLAQPAAPARQDQVRLIACQSSTHPITALPGEGRDPDGMAVGLTP